MVETRRRRVAAVKKEIKGTNKIIQKQNKKKTRANNTLS
jgi:hypothetical protein